MQLLFDVASCTGGGQEQGPELALGTAPLPPNSVVS